MVMREVVGSAVGTGASPCWSASISVLPPMASSPSLSPTRLPHSRLTESTTAQLPLYICDKSVWLYPLSATHALLIACASQHEVACEGIVLCDCWGGRPDARRCPMY